MSAIKQNVSISVESWGKTQDGKIAYLYRLKNSHGNQVVVSNYGATVTSIQMRDRQGKLDDVVLGYRTLAEYENNDGYLGAMVGRFANRIAKGRFMLDGYSYSLTQNEGDNQLHGGFNGLHNRVWSVETFETDDTVGLLLKTHLLDGEEGYPGQLDVDLTLTFNDDNELIFDYKAVSDKHTIVNLTHHGYFNLSGFQSPDCLEHKLRIHASYYTPVDSHLIPTGEIKGVEESKFDFRQLKLIGQNLSFTDDSAYPTGGYDHNWVLDKSNQRMHIAAVAIDPKTQRRLTVETTQPGLQFYSGQYLNHKTTKDQKFYAPFAGFCLETQHFPDSPNHDHFPSVRLDKGNVYSEKTIYRFDFI